MATQGVELATRKQNLIDFHEDEVETHAEAEAKNDDDDAVNEDSIASQQCDMNDSYLQNVITVGTLILGFIFTGTILARGFTGEESYDWSSLGPFLATSITAAACAMFSLLFSFQVSSRGCWNTAVKGSQAGAKRYLEGTLMTILAELLLFYAVIQYLISVEQYLDMTLRGPDICVGGPATVNKTKADLIDVPYPGPRKDSTLEGTLQYVWNLLRFKPDMPWWGGKGHVFPRGFSVCADTGGDLWEDADRVCGENGVSRVTMPMDVSPSDSVMAWSRRNRDDPHFHLCSAYDFYNNKIIQKHREDKQTGIGAENKMVMNCNSSGCVEDEQPLATWFFLYDETFFPPDLLREVHHQFKTEVYLKILEDVAALHCRADQTQKLFEEFCNPERQNKAACAVAIKTKNEVRKCRAAVMEGVRTCTNVCSGDMHFFFKAHSVQSMGLSMIRTFIFFLFFLVRTFMTTRYYFRSLREWQRKEKDLSPWRGFFLTLGFDTCAKSLANVAERDGNQS